MKRLIFFVGILLFAQIVNAQQEIGKDGVIRNPEIIPIEFLGVTEPWSEVARRIEREIEVNLSAFEQEQRERWAEWGALKRELEEEEEEGKQQGRFVNKKVNANALPLGEDPLRQKEYNTRLQRTTQIGNWEGMITNTGPGDPAMDVGPNHVVQLLNNGNDGTHVKIWDKSGNVVLGETSMAALCGTTVGLGDPIVLYDERADRWLVTEFSKQSANRLYIALSQTPDPTGAYYTFSVSTSSFPDYPKYSIWDDSYVVTTNENTSTVYALDRNAMLSGGAASAQKYTMSNYGTIGFQTAAPVSLMGTTLSGGNPMVMRIRDDGWGGVSQDALEIWEININWASPGSSTMSQTQVIPVSPYDSELCGYTSFSCIPQPSGNNNLDPLREILMNRVMYRNFGTHESIVCAHVTDVNGSDLAGIRWYELRRTTGPTGNFSIYQEGTYAPSDGNNRWMPTIGISASGNIGLAYNVASSSTHPDIRYTGRKVCDPLGIMTETEVQLVDGTSSNNVNRWGDYNAMGVDPVDGETFWFTAQYNPTSQAHTRIGAFKIDQCGATVQFNSSTYNVSEPDANVNNGCLDYYVLNVPISISNDPSQPADITVNVSGGTATIGEDFDISNTSFNLDGATLTGTVEIWVYNDALIEGTETIILDYSLNANGGDATAGSLNQTVTVTINDDDQVPSAMTQTVTILTQDFEGGMSPFTTVNPSGNTAWQIGNVGTTPNNAFAIPADNTTQFAWIDDDDCNCNQNDVDLLFPSVDLSTYTAASVTFSSYYENNNYQGDQESATLTVSIGGGAFTTIGSLTPSTIDGSWTAQSFDVSAYVGNTDVQFAINYSDGAGWLYGCAVDNFLLTGEGPIDIQTIVNTGSGDEKYLGPNQTVHFYDPATSDVMMTIENTSSFDYGCVTVEVDRDGSSPTALEFASTAIPDYLHSKTYKVTPANNNPSGTYNVTLYYKETEVTAWESFTGNSRNNLEVIKVAGNNRINDVTPANYTSYTIDNIPATMGSFNTDLTFSAPFTNGFSGFGLGIYNITTVTVTHTSSSTNVTCNGVNDGTIIVIASGGTAPYQYSIDGGTTWQASNTFNGLVPGTYDVIAKDAGNNESTVSQEVITEPTILSYTSSTTDVTCNGDSDGTIALNALGGSSPYQYSIDAGSNFQSSGIFSGLGGGTYSIIVRDANNCQSTGTIDLIEPKVVSHTSSFTNPVCSGASDGTITLSGTGGVGSFQYSINGGTNYQTSGSFTGLGSGTYNIIVKDGNNCQNTETITLTGPTAITYTESLTNVSCNGGSDGSIVLTGNGGTGSLQYSINGGFTFQTAGSYTSLTAGTYSIAVRDANDCQTSGTTTITEPAVLSHSTIVTDASCGPDGSITLAGSGGTSPYQYSINGGSSFQPSGSFSGLAGGSYSVVVKDAKNCQSTENVIINSASQITLSSSNTNVVCNGGMDGAISLSGTGGTGTLQFSIDGGTNYQTSGSFTGLSAGTYNAVVKDDNNCQTTEIITLTQPSAITYSENVNNVFCSGDNSGNITLIGSGGTGSLQYSINGGSSFQSSGSFSLLTAGNYNVVIKDANNCQTTGSITVSEPGQLSHSTNTTAITCNGGSNGSVTITANGGTPTYQYTIDGGSTWQSSNSFTGLTAGTYNVQVQDVNSCISVVSSAVITEPAEVGYSSNTSNLTCFEDATGSIILNGTGGTSPYQYSINGGVNFQSSGSFTGLDAGAYSIVIEDVNNCQATSSITLTQPAQVTHVSTLQNPSCNGTNTGSITIAVSGGIGTIQYSINNGVSFQTSNVFSGLAAGTYNIVVKDVNNCQSIETVVLTAPNAINYSDNVTNVSCKGGNDGEVLLTASGGAPTYLFSIDGGTTFQSSGSFSGLSAGTYNVVVEDANACQTSGTVNITEPTGVTYTVTPTNPTCNGGNDGSISFSASGGPNPIRYSINGGANFQGASNFTGLTAGSYNVVVRDGNGCTQSETVTLTNPAALSFNASTTPETCGANDGSITINASGGTGTYQYSINGGASFQTNNSFSNIGAGVYSIIVEDANGCQTSGNQTVGNNGGANITNVATTGTTCFGNIDGTITVTVSGGTGTIEYSNDGGSTFQTNNVFASVGAGTYNIVVKDANGCQTTANATVSDPAAITVTATSSPESCGQGNGSISISATGGTGTLSYSIDNGINFQASSSFVNLSSNTYDIVVQDANNCQETTSVIVGTDSGPVINSTVTTAPLCNGGANGEIFIAASGGSGALQFSIDNGSTYQSSATFTNLSGGNYNIVVRDAGGCTVSSVVSLSQPTALTESSSVSNVTCNGGNDGSITLTASGGTIPYQYSINNGVTYQSSATFSGVTAGNYNYIIRDGNGCTIGGTASVTQPSVVNISYTSTNPVCNGDANGSIIISANGGVGFYQFSIDGGATFQGSGNFTGVNGGTYNIIVEDANGCQATGTVTITEPSLVSYASTVNAVSCFGGNDGSILITGSGGTGGLQYSIDGGTSYQAAGNFSGLSAGTYAVVVRDGNGCQKTGNITVTEPTSLVASSTSSNPACNGSIDGSITVSASGGTGTYTYSLDGATYQASATIGGLASGNYTWYVRDANGCQLSGSESLTDPAGVTYSESTTTENCGLNDGSLTISASGGAAPLEYSIDGGSNFEPSGQFNNLSAGVYNFIIRDANGCATNGSTTIGSSSGVGIVSTSSSEPLCNGGNDGDLSIVASGGAAPLLYSIDGGSTFQSSASFGSLSAGTYNVVVEDATGCQVNTTETINEPGALTFSSSVTNENCGQSNGGMVLDASGGTAPYSFSINGGTTSQPNGVFSNLTAANYPIQIVDANGCLVLGTVTVVGTGGVAINTVSSVDPTCNGVDDGTISISVTGGTSPISYSVNNGTSYQTNGTYNGLSAGTYDIIVRDAAGCQAIGQTTLSNPQVIDINTTSTDESCGAQDGSIAISASGGTGTYQYSINGGSTFQASAVFNNLTSGAYSVVVEDANGCQSSTLEAVNGTGGATINSVSFTDASCYGVADATLSVNASGGTSPLTYSIDGANWQASSVFTGLTAGSYIILVKDANGCQELISQTINSPSEIQITISSTDANCGNNDGSAIASVTGGNGPYSYQWDDQLNQSTQTAINLAGGFYTVVVMDNNGCSASEIALINNIGEPDLTVSTANVTCYGESNGSAAATVSGGSAPITYQWNDPANQTAATATGLAAGSYVVQVTDGNGCIAVEYVDINEPDSITIVASITNTTCAYNNGIVIANVTGGTPAYSYNWNDGQSQSFSAAVGLAPGNYMVEVTDANNCSSMLSVSVADSDSLVVTVDVLDETCIDSYDGGIATNVSGGLSPYSYLWNTGDSTEVLNELTAGEYVLTVHDANQCEAVLLIPIEVIGETCLVIPSAISPNGDGANDVWAITGIDDHPNALIEIYNRWGSLIYSTDEYNHDWNGTYNGEDLPAGVYYYVVTLSEDDVYTGSITVLR